MGSSVGRHTRIVAVDPGLPVQPEGVAGIDRLDLGGIQGSRRRAGSLPGLVLPGWLYERWCSGGEKRQQQGVEVVREVLKPERRCGAVDLEVAQPPVGRHPHATEAQGIEKPTGHGLEG